MYVENVEGSWRKWRKVVDSHGRIYYIIKAVFRKRILEKYLDDYHAIYYIVCVSNIIPQ